MNEPRTELLAWYRELCAELRGFERNADAEPCWHCDKPKKSHFVDGTGRCSINVTTREYMPKNQAWREYVRKVVAMLENLFEEIGLKTTQV